MLNIFESARVRLTFWYVLLMMVVSAVFSLIIYQGVDQAVQQNMNQLHRRMLVQNKDTGNFNPLTAKILLEELREARARVIVILLATNGGILVITAFAGYFLAGKTLEPIEGAMHKQRRFIAAASHELRTPLTSMRTSLEVALRAKKTKAKEAKQILAENLKSLTELQELTDRLLNQARYYVNNKLNYQELDLIKVVSKVESKILPLAKKKKIKLKTDVEAVLFRVDKDKFGELLTILLDNAIKYTQAKGNVTLSVALARKRLVITVQDTGIGIKKEDYKRIFDPFYRVDTSRNKTGVGLGLSIAKEIVEAHSGRITVNSEEKKGSTFVVELPVRKD